MNKQQRADVRWALSDAFVDNDVDYRAIARLTNQFNQNEIKKILFSEVAPVCHSNLESVLPTIWTCFDRDELEMDIEKMLRARAASRTQHLLDTLFTKWLTYKYNYIWIELSESREA